MANFNQLMQVTVITLFLLRYNMANFKIHGIDNLLKTLQALPKEVTQTKRGGIAAKAVRAGAKVIHAEEKVTLQRAIDINGDESSGVLMQNLKVRRKKAKFKGEHFTIGVGNKQYPSGDKGQTTRLNGVRLEYGTAHQPATPWARPAFESKKEEAAKQITDTLLKDVEVLAQKHLK